MRLGSERSLAFDLQPVEPSWEVQGAGDAGPWAALRIVAGGRVLTRAVIPSDARVTDHVHVPLAPLCDWWVKNLAYVAHEESARLFRCDVTLHESLARWNGLRPPRGSAAHEWEDARFDWYARHFWLAGAEGAWLPDLAFVRSDDRLWISHGQPRFLDPGAPAYSEPPGVVAIAWPDALVALAALVELVASEIVARGLSESYPWANEPRLLEHAMAFPASGLATLLAGSPPAGAMLLGKLGISADAGADAHPSLRALWDLKPEDAVLEALAGLEADSDASSSNRLQEMRAEVEVVRPSASMEAAGQDAARTIRELLGNPEQPIESGALRALLTDQLVVALREQPLGSSFNHAACVARPSRRPVAVLFQHTRTKKSWVRRMEEARLVAHLLLDPLSSDAPLGAGSSVDATGPRRRRSGAFAAELLLPRQGIEAVLDEKGAAPDDSDVFSALMSRFGVGARTAAFQLWNHRLLASEEDRDALIDEHAFAG